MASPRVMALAPGAAPSVPPSWHSFPSPGFRLSVPTAWPVSEPIRGTYAGLWNRDLSRSHPRHRQGVLGSAMRGYVALPGRALGRRARRQQNPRSYWVVLPGGACLTLTACCLSEQHSGLQHPVASRHGAWAGHPGLRLYRRWRVAALLPDNSVLIADCLTSCQRDWNRPASASALKPDVAKGKAQWRQLRRRRLRAPGTPLAQR